MSSISVKNEQCKCCSAVESVPKEHWNRSGLDELEYRIGRFMTFKESMKDAISQTPELAELTIREDDDFTIALMDGTAVLLDVLTFYQERIANEGFLRTSRERKSLLELARAIGYELAPGVAASTYLAYSMETAKESAKSAVISIGSKVQSVPGQGETPQTFETIEEIEARPEWNEMIPRRTALRIPKLGSLDATLTIPTVPLLAGDKLLFVGKERLVDSASERWDIRTIQTVTNDYSNNTCKVTWLSGLGTITSNYTIHPSEKNIKVYVFRSKASIFGHNAVDWTTLSDSAKATYLGLASQESLTAEMRKEWQDFAIYAPHLSSTTFPFSGIDTITSPTVEQFTHKFQAGVEAAATAQHMRAVQQSQAVINSFREVGEQVEQMALHATESIKTVANSVLRGMIGVMKENVDTIGSTVENVREQAGNTTGTISSMAEERATRLANHYAANPTDSTPPPVIIARIEQEIADEQANNPTIAGTIQSGANESIKAFLDGISTGTIPVLQEFVNDIVAGTTADFGDFRQKVGALASTSAEALVLANNAAEGIAVAIELNAFMELKAKLPNNTIDSIYNFTKAELTAKAAFLSLSQGGREVIEAAKVALENAYAPIVGRDYMRGSYEPDQYAICLDTVYSDILEKSWVALSSANYTELYLVKEAKTTARADFMLTGKSTRLTLEGENLSKFINDRRSLVVHCKSEELSFAEETDDTLIVGNRIALSDKVGDPGLGRRLIIRSKAESGAETCELAELASVEKLPDRTLLVLSKNLQNKYKPSETVIFGNVALATHGETKAEVLGGGDGLRKFKKFLLKQTPLTHISSDDPSGAASTLGIRVDGILWEERASFYNVGPDDRAFVTRRTEDGKVIAIFGDGRTGARIPQSQSNVTAFYRVGIGTDGMVNAHQLTQIVTKPLGVKTVTNPIEAIGAENSETINQARTNAPLTVQTLDRIVSYQDYEDFARTFAGIAKVKLDWIWNGRSRVLHLTVAGANGSAIDENSDIRTKLLTAIDNSRHAQDPVDISSYKSIHFKLSGRVMIHEDYVESDVLINCHDAVINSYGFDQRQLGQSLARSEILSNIQAVPGVIAVDLDVFCLDSESYTYRIASETSQPTTVVVNNSLIAADSARWRNDKITPAELLTVNSSEVKLVTW